MADMRFKRRAKPKTNESSCDGKLSDGSPCPRAAVQGSKRRLCSDCAIRKQKGLPARDPEKKKVARGK